LTAEASRELILSTNIRSCLALMGNIPVILSTRENFLQPLMIQEAIRENCSVTAHSHREYLEIARQAVLERNERFKLQTIYFPELRLDSLPNIEE
jgi:hypothetical protein